MPNDRTIERARTSRTGLALGRDAITPTASSPPLAMTWQEQSEQADRIRKDPRFHLLPWNLLLAEGIAVRHFLMSDPKGRAKFTAMYEPGEHHQVFGEAARIPGPETFTITNAQHFQFLPSIDAIKRNAIEAALVEAATVRQPALALSQSWLTGQSVNARGILSDAQARTVETTVRAEQSHLLYHRAMWRAHGRRVLVLDPTTYTLLANSELPALPAWMLSAPWPAFYIKLPPHMFEYDVRDVRKDVVDRRFAEGICVALDYADPGDEHDTRIRELAYMVMGEEEGHGPDGRNCAFTTTRFAPSAKLSDFDSGVTVHARAAVYSDAGSSSDCCCISRASIRTSCRCRPPRGARFTTSARPRRARRRSRGKPKSCAARRGCPCCSSARA
jgi:hypothetical protein